MVGQRETWKTHVGMMFAMIGTEVGLGNIWRFPYLCGKYGGGSFLVPYMVLHRQALRRHEELTEREEASGHNTDDLPS